MTNRNNINRFALLLTLGLSLSGCKEVLYSELSETEANEMVAVLAASGIDASRNRDKNGIYELLVAPSQIAPSVVVLGELGYPNQKFESLGDVFSADGIIGTPFEQNARFIHAMNEELSRTITSILNIREARVLITSPPRGRYERTAPAASASVTIHYDDGFNANVSVSKIKQIVSSSVANLSYDDVVVAAFHTGAPSTSALTATGTQPSNVPVTASSVVPGIDGRGGYWTGLQKNNLGLRLLGLFLLIAAAFCAVAYHQTSDKRKESQ